jgi:hypothetical protein
MNPLTIGIGALIVAYGCYTAWARVKAPQQFHKLEAMKKFWGDGPGLAIHFVSYTLVPMGVGVAIIVAGVNGWSVVDLLRA